MNYPHIARTVFSEPWLITAAGHHAVASLVKSRILNAPVAERAPGVGICGDKVEVEQAEIIGDIMHIPIGGIIGQRLSGLDRGSGAVDVLDIGKELEQAEEDPRVRSILLDIDSPGGTVSGVPELADLIAQIDKPIYSYTSGQMCSAAYWLAAASDGIFCTRTANIGSIGVYIPWMDITEYYKSEGVAVKLFASGKYKGMGYPGTSLTPDQEQLLLDRVNYIAEMFYSHVRTNREYATLSGKQTVTDDTMQGQVFMGQQAIDAGLADIMVGSKEEVLPYI